jgi:hypothetical protein
MSGRPNKMLMVWLVPFLVGIVSMAGLLLALFADGLADVVSVGLLAVPAGVCVWEGYLER